MGILYRNSQGIETPVAGLAPAGQLVPSVSLYQSGSFSVPTTAVQYGAQLLSIIFTAPMPDTNYEVTFSGPTSVDPWYSMMVRNKTVNGFDVRCICLAPTGVGNILTYDWQAFKLMTDEVTALDEAKIEQNTKNFANDFSTTSSYAVGDYCTYQGVLYRCTVQHTASAWNSSHFTATNVGGEIKDINNTAKRMITSFDVFDDLGLTAGATYTLMQLWQIIYNKYGRCFYKGSVVWSGANAWTISDGSNTISVNNGTLDLDVDVYAVWRTFKGTVLVNDGAANGAFYTINANIGASMSTIYQKLKHLG